MGHEKDSRVLGRRTFLRAGVGAGVGLGVAGATAAAGLSSYAEAATIGGVVCSRALAARAVLAQSCVLTPAEATGPYYLPVLLERRDITEGQPGIPFTIFLKVVRASDCSPVVGAAVDIWHSDIGGDYSGFSTLGTAGSTWLRGYQITPADGIVRFESIYPGWYPARTAHVHMRIYPGGPVVFTTQLYMPDHISDEVYETPLYVARGPKPHKNVDDTWYHEENVFSIRQISAVSIFGAAPKPQTPRLYAGLTIALA